MYDCCVACVLRVSLLKQGFAVRVSFSVHDSSMVRAPAGRWPDLRPNEDQHCKGDAVRGEPVQMMTGQSTFLKRLQ